MATSRRKLTRVCLRCKRALPLTAFEYNPVTKRRSRLCAEDRLLRNVAVCTSGQWGWAQALHKEQGMMLRRNSADDTVGYDFLTPAMLFALMDLQQQRCWLTGDNLLLPSIPLVINTTLTAWRDRLPEVDALLTPRLVRVIQTAPWAAGNICFIANYMHPLYMRCGTLGALRATGAKIAQSAGLVYQQGVILRRAVDLQQRRHYMQNNTECV